MIIKPEHNKKETLYTKNQKGRLGEVFRPLLTFFIRNTIWLLNDMSLLFYNIANFGITYVRKPSELLSTTYIIYRAKYITLAGFSAHFWHFYQKGEVILGQTSHILSVAIFFSTLVWAVLQCVRTFFVPSKKPYPIETNCFYMQFYGKYPIFSHRAAQII